MRRLGLLALDFDGTLAEKGRLGPEVRAALGAARVGRVPVVLLTYRLLEDLRATAGDLSWADAVVAESGSVVAFEGGHERVLGAPPPARLLDGLEKAGVAFEAGRCTVQADGGDAGRILSTVRELELAVGLAFDGDRSLVVPFGISKSTGLREVLRAFRLSPLNALAIGDAEIDRDLLATCGVGAAVAWGSGSLLEIADDVVPGRAPSDVAPYLRRAITSMQLPERRAHRRRVTLGRDKNGGNVTLTVRERNLLVAGDPRTGKSWATGLLCEQLAALGYSLCVVDPEGDYAPLEALPGVVLLGGAGPPPGPHDVASALRHPDVSVVLDLSKFSHAEKIGYLHVLLPLVARLRRRAGLPHVIVIDEAHYFLNRPDARDAVDLDSGGYILVTYRVSHLDRTVLAAMDAVIVMHAEEACEVRCLGELAGVAGDRADWAALLADLPLDEAVVIRTARTEEAVVERFRLASRFTAHVRHRAKYRDVPLPATRAFVFTRAGRPTGAVAQTLSEFVAGLSGCGDEVLDGHARRRDFSRWLAEVFGDQPLASEISVLERRRCSHGLVDLGGSIIETISARYELKRSGADR